MRMIGTIANQADAERFSDFLLSQGMENQLEQPVEGETWQVWVEHDDKIDRAKAELEAYLRNPSDAKYDAAGDHAEKIRKEEEKKQQRLRKRFVDVRTTWGRPQQWNAPLTMALVAICIIVGFATQLGKRMNPVGDWLQMESYAQEQRVVDEFLQRHGLEPGSAIPGWDKGLSSIRHGQVWRLVTPIFLHLSFLHLLFNLFWLLDLGRMIEVQRGTWRFAGLVLLAAVLSNLAQYWWRGPFFGGMSGVVYALLGYVYVKGRYEPHLGLGISQQSVAIMMIWLVLGFTGMIGDIANAAHLGGLVVGAAVAYAPTALRKLKQARRRLQ